MPYKNQHVTEQLCTDAHLSCNLGCVQHQSLMQQYRKATGCYGTTDDWQSFGQAWSAFLSATEALYICFASFTDAGTPIACWGSRISLTFPPQHSCFDCSELQVVLSRQLLQLRYSGLLLSCIERMYGVKLLLVWLVHTCELMKCSLQACVQD